MLKQDIIRILEEYNIDLIGFANIKKYIKIKGGLNPSEILTNAKIAIVYLTQLKKLEKMYGKWYIVSLNNHLSKTNKRVVEFLKNEGCEAVGISENRYCRELLIGDVSFREMAVLAGLGSIGRNQMLLTEQFGPRVVIGVILTNANIKPNKPFNKELCTKCGVCIEACPTKAIHKNSYDRWKCKNRRKILGKGCGIPCVELCPIGN